MTNIYKQKGFYACVLALAFLVLSAQTWGRYPASPKKELGQKLEDYLACVEAFGFSGAVLIAVDGEILIHKGYGMAQQDKQIPVNTDTVFSIASISKQFTAAAIMKLESEKRLHLKDPISQYIEGIPPDKTKITVHHLLTHTSGLPFQCGNVPAKNKEEFLECLWSTPLATKPGQRYFYSNAGYALLTLIVEAVSGQSYPVFLREKLLNPAGMSQTGFYYEISRWPSELLAHQYTWAVDHGSNIGDPFDWNFRGAADLVTSAMDLYKWDLALQKELVLPKNSQDKLFHGYIKIGDKGVKAGYGWNIVKDNAGTHHISGGTMTFGFNSTFRRYPSKKAVAVVLSNINYGLILPTDFVNQGIEGILLNRRYSSPPNFSNDASSLFSSYEGKYLLGENDFLEVKATSQGLVVSPFGQKAVDFLVAKNKKESRKLEEHSDKARRLFKAMKDDKFQNLDDIMDKNANPNEEIEAYKNWLKGLEERNGSFLSFRIIGTIPQEESFRTYIELNFEKGTQVRRLRWINGRLISILNGALPLIPTHFMPLSKDHFVGFHLAFQKEIKIRFQTDEKDKTTQLCAKDPQKKDITAQKQAYPQVNIQTDWGDIIVEIYETQAPITAKNFLRYVTEERYKDACFYRVVRMDNQPNDKVKIEVIQGGLYDQKGKRLPAIEHETTDKTGILHKDGVISMARSHPGTASSEFFICINDQPELDFGGKRNPDGQGFSAFGKIIQGMDVVKKIQKQPAKGQILDPIVKIKNITLHSPS